MTGSGRADLEPAFVLHHHPYRNTSLLIEAFSRDFGRIGLVARGVRSRHSRWQGLLQPFSPLLLSWSGRGDLVTLQGVEAEAPSARLRGQALFCGYYLNELLLRLLPRHAPHPVLFQAYRTALRALEQAASDTQQQQALRLFEKHLLQDLGYGLLLAREAEADRPIVADRRYRYQLERGPLPDDGTATGIPLSGDTLLALEREELCAPGQLREAKALMRAALALYLGDRPLKSREVYRDASRLEGAREAEDGP